MLHQYKSKVLNSMFGVELDEAANLNNQMSMINYFVRISFSGITVNMNITMSFYRIQIK